MFLIRNWRVVKGDTFTDADVRGGAKVAVLGQSVADRLFPGRSPLGQTIRIKKTPFQVVGVLEPKGQSAMGQDYDDAVYVPHTSWQSQVQGGLQKYIPGMILVSAATPELTSRAMAQVTAILRDRHHLQQGEDDDFFVRDLTEMSNAMQQGTQTLSALLASIAAVSLLVGGIGIMNIMLVSVTERTREIGLRMAIGARPGVILRQFLVEAMVLSFTGGIIGILAGSGIGWYLAQQFDWPVALRGDVMLLALGFSAAVGIGFGLYPARLASRLDPIDALRYE
jgi:putative ABC transport system permease protein